MWWSVEECAPPSVGCGVPPGRLMQCVCVTRSGSKWFCRIDGGKARRQRERPPTRVPMWCAPLPISGHIRAARVLIARATNPACGFSQIGREANATRATTSRDQTTDRRSDSLPQDRQTINRSLDGPFPLTDPRCCWPFPRPTALTIVPVTRPACHRLGGRWPPQSGHLVILTSPKSRAHSLTWRVFYSNL